MLNRHWAAALVHLVLVGADTKGCSCSPFLKAGALSRLANASRCCALYLDFGLPHRTQLPKAWGRWEVLALCPGAFDAADELKRLAQLILGSITQ